MTSIVSIGLGRVEAGTAVRKLARLAAPLLADERNDDPLILALRLAVDQLFRRESADRRRHLLLAADVLELLRDGRRLTDYDFGVLDLVQAAALIRAGESGRASAVIEARRPKVSSGALRDVLRELEAELPS